MSNNSIVNKVKGSKPLVHLYDPNNNFCYTTTLDDLVQKYKIDGLKYILDNGKTPPYNDRNGKPIESKPIKLDDYTASQIRALIEKPQRAIKVQNLKDTGIDK